MYTYRYMYVYVYIYIYICIYEPGSRAVPPSPPMVMVFPRPPCGVVVEGTQMRVPLVFSVWITEICCTLQLFDVPPAPLWYGCGRHQYSCAMDL